MVCIKIFLPDPRSLNLDCLEQPYYTQILVP